MSPNERSESENGRTPNFSPIPCEALRSPLSLRTWRAFAALTFPPFAQTPESMPRLRVAGKFGFASENT